MPAIIVSDKGAQFKSALWAALCGLLNINHPHHCLPPAVEQVGGEIPQAVEDALRSRVAAANWHDHLPRVMLGVRATFRDDSDFSPAEFVFGAQLVLPGQFVDTAESPLPSFLEDLQTTMANHSLTQHNSAPAPTSLLRSSCWPASSWSAGWGAAAVGSRLRRPLLHAKTIDL